MRPSTSNKRIPSTFRGYTEYFPSTIRVQVHILHIGTLWAFLLSIVCASAYIMPTMCRPIPLWFIRQQLNSCSVYDSFLIDIDVCYVSVFFPFFLTRCCCICCAVAAVLNLFVPDHPLIWHHFATAATATAASAWAINSSYRPSHSIERQMEWFSVL